MMACFRPSILLTVFMMFHWGIGTSLISVGAAPIPLLKQDETQEPVVSEVASPLAAMEIEVNENWGNEQKRMKADSCVDESETSFLSFVGRMKRDVENVTSNKNDSSLDIGASSITILPATNKTQSQSAGSAASTTIKPATNGTQPQPDDSSTATSITIKPATTNDNLPAENKTEPFFDPEDWEGFSVEEETADKEGQDQEIVNSTEPELGANDTPEPDFMESNITFPYNETSEAENDHDSTHTQTKSQLGSCSPECFVLSGLGIALVVVLLVALVYIGWRRYRARRDSYNYRTDKVGGHPESPPPSTEGKYLEKEYLDNDDEYPADRVNAPPAGNESSSGTQM